MSEVWRSAPDLVKDATAAPAAWLATALKMFGLQEESRLAEGPGIAARGRFFPVRTLSAEDTDALRSFLQDGLSEESRRLRFMTPMPSVPESAAAWLARRIASSGSTPTARARPTTDSTVSPAPLTS